MAEWYCQIDSQEYGPYEAKQLKEFAAEGRLQPTDQVRKGADGRWVPASKVQGLPFAGAAAAPAAPAAPVQPVPPSPPQFAPSLPSAAMQAPQFAPPVPQPVAAPAPTFSPFGASSAGGPEIQVNPYASPQTAKTPEAPAPGGALRVFVDAPLRVPGLQTELGNQLRRFLGDEQFNVTILPLDPTGAGITADDLVLRCGAQKFDYGNRAMRYFLFPIPLFGPGSCVLEIAGDVHGRRPVPSSIKTKSLQAIGLFGGSGPGLMKQNVKNVTKKMGTIAAQHVSGRKIVNTRLYHLALAAMVLGLISLLPIPCVSPVLALFAIGMGLFAFVPINSRKLPKRKGMALTGVITGALGLIEGIALFALIVSQK